MRSTVLWKYLRSFFKRDWGLEDYPIKVLHSPTPFLDLGPRFKPIPWGVQVVNWWSMVGHGDTQEAAYDDLRAKFLAYKSEHGTLPRPGTGPPLELASSERIDRFPDLAREFFAKILEMDYEECLVTDESSMWDFHSEESDDHLHEQIAKVYGVDTRDIKGANIVTILERIAGREPTG
jgi:hypothetical protein